MSVITKEIQEFINRQLHSTAADLMLQASKYPQWDMKLIAQQLIGKQIAKKKLPSWFNNHLTQYPVRLSLEQCSSENTANYKSNLVGNGKGIDLTGGFGVDTFAFSKKTKHVIYCEINASLAKLAKENFNAFKVSNIEVFMGDGLACLKKQKKLDWIFIDPARRKQGERVYRLEDCEPNVIDLKKLLFQKANTILIKTAPLLDIQQTLKELDCVKEVHVLSVNNDCKEVLYLLENGYTKNAKIIATNLKTSSHSVFNFNYLDEQNSAVNYSLPLTYLYEPNSSLMKAGAFKSIAVKFRLFKLHKNSHLYTSNHLVKDFPGRTFKIRAVIPADRKTLEKHAFGTGNLACRNFPQKIADLKRKLKLKDGGINYIFATTLVDEKPKLILCEKH